MDALTPADNRTSKLWLIGGVGVALSIALGTSLVMLYRTDSVLFFVLAVLSLIGFLGWFVMQALTIQSTRLATIIIASETLAIGVGIFTHPTIAAVVLLIIGFFLLLFGHFRSRSEVDLALQVRVSNVARRSLPLVATVIAIVATVLYVNTIRFDQPQDILKDDFVRLLRPTEWASRLVVPSFSVDWTFHELADGLLDANSLRWSLPPELQELSDEDHAIVVQESALRFRQIASDGLGVPIDSTDTLADVLHRSLVKQLSQFSDFTLALIPVGIGIGFFLIFRGILVIFNWLGVFVAWLFYLLFTKIGFIKVEFENKAKEVVTL